MSASTGPSSKGEKGKSKYQSLDINSIYNTSRSETSESQTAKSTIPRKHGMQHLGKVPQRRPPANLPSLKSENSGNDPSISLVPQGGQGWVVKTGESQQLAHGGGTGNTNSSQNNQPATVQNQMVTPTPAPAAGVTPAPILPSGPPPSQTSSHDKTWSSVTGGSQASSLGVEHGPSFLAHQSPQFRQEFPSLSGEPGGAPAHPTPAYGPGPSLRPQTEPGSWSQGTHAKPSSQSQTNHTISTPFKSVVPSFMLSQGTGFPMFPEGIQKRPRSQATHPENRMSSSGSNSSRPMLNNSNQSGSNTGEGEDFALSRPIIREEELVKMDELTQDSSWAANDDIDYNEQLSFSDGESVGEDEKEKENKLRDKSKNQQLMRDLDRKDDTEKSSRMDDDEIWKEKRRQTTEHKMAAAEKAKQRKEEEEKRYEESRSKKTNKDMCDYHSSISSTYTEWDKEERTKSLENFRQMTQFPLEPRSNMNRDKGRERDMRGERDTQYRYQHKPPRFRNKESALKPQQFGGGFEKNWSNHNSFGRRGGPDPGDKDDDYRKDRHDRPSPSDSGPDRFRLNMRDDRNMDSNKRNYCDSSHMDYSQSSFQSNREADKDKDLNKDFDYRMNEKDSTNRDVDKEWESPKGDNEPRSFHDNMRRNNKPLNDNASKQASDHFEEKDNDWHPQRPENRQPDRLDLRERHDRDGRSDHRMEMKHDIRELRNDSRLDRQDRLENRLHSRGDYRSLDNRDGNRLDTRYDRDNSQDIRLDSRDRHDNRPESQDSARSDIRPSRPDSRDSRASRDSRNSKDSSDKPLLMEEYSMPESYLNDNMERLSFKEKETRHDPVLRGRDHAPGPITQEKLVAYEHKHNQSQLEKSDPQEKENEDKKGKKLIEGETVTLAWGDSRDDKTSSFPESSLTPQEPSPRNDFPIDDCKSVIKGDDMDKRKENGGGMRERRDDKPGSGGGRGNRNRGASRSGGYSSGSKYNAYSGPNWQNKDRQQRQGSSRGHGKHWNQSESDVSGDEISAESGKDDKKQDSRKQDSSPKFSTWKGDSKEKRDEKKDMKITGSESDKDRSKGDKKMGGGLGDGFRKGGDGGNFAPRPTGEPSKRGRGGGGMRGQSRVCMGQTLYGPPESKPFRSSSGGQSQSSQHSLGLEPQDKLNSSQQSGRKDDGQSGNKGRDNDKGPRGKAGGGGIRSQDENWETTSETSDGSDAKKSNKNRNKFDKKPRGTIGDKRNIINSCSGHLNGRPDTKPEESGSEKKSCKDETDTTGYSNNGFQEVKSKKIGREGRGVPGSVPKEETKRSQSKGSKDKSGGGVKSQLKSFTREFVNHKPRLQRPDNKCKLQQQQVQSSQDVSDMNKINQSVSSLFPLSKNSNDVTTNSCPPPPPTHNAWNKPINASLRTTPPLSSTLTQLTAASAQITTDKSNLEELGQPGNTVPASSPTTDKAVSKMTREVVDKSHLEGPPVNTIIFENTNYKRDPGDMGMKPRYPIKTPSRTPLDKTRDRKMEDELAESNHGMGLSGFKSAAELQASEGKPQDNIQVPISFSKNEDNADMKLDFAFDTDLSQLSDDKSNQSMHVGQSSTADLNQKIASVKKVWDTPPSSMSGHVDEGTTSSFTQGFTSDKSLDPSAPSHHNDHTDFNTADSVYGSSQLSGAGAYVAAGSPMMKPDTIVSNANTMCKTNMFQVSPQPQQVTVLPHPGPLSTPPLPNVLSYQPGYSNNLSAVPSPPNVVYNSQQAAGPQTEIYQTYSLSTAQMHGSGSRSYPDFSSYNMSQNSSFQPNVYIQSAPPAPQSVFQSPNQYRLPPHGSAAALSQQMSSNPNTILMSSSSNSVVSGSQVKSTQGSMQPTAIGSKSAGGPPTAAFAPGSPQILLIEPPSVSFIHQSYHRPTALQHSSSYYTSNSALAAGGSSGGLFNSPSLLSSGGTGATTPNLPSASPFGVQPPASYSQQQPPSSTQPPSHHQQPPYPSQQPQMAGSFRTQTGYPKTGQHPSDSVKSSSNDQFQNMFSSSVQGSTKPRIGVVKPQPQPNASPQSQHKFAYNANPQSVSQSNIGYQQNSAGNGSSRQPQVVASQSSRYISPIQRPMGPSYSQQQAAAIMQQQVQARQQAQQHRLQQQQQQPPQHQGRSAPPPQQQPKQYYQQQGGGMKLEGTDSVKNEVEDQGKASQDKSSKDDSPSEQ